MKLLIRLFLVFVGAFFISIALIASLAPNSDNGHFIIIPIAVLFISTVVVIVIRLVRWLS